MSPVCLFDDSLEILMKRIVSELGKDAAEQGVVLRDALGQLTFFSKSLLAEDRLERLSTLLHQDLGKYARPDRVIADCSVFGAEKILNDKAARKIHTAETQVAYVDRRIVGADWLNLTLPKPSQTVRLVFASVKGGVGRSTALSVVAAEQARLKRNVLVVDLDLEAPGVGSMLLDEELQPELGVLDYLVEQNLSDVSEELVSKMVQTSRLTDGAGLVDVVPVVGKKSDAHPENFLAKLSRGMIEGLANEEPISVAGKIARLIDGLENRRSYDLVLVDARAGLAELTAGPLLALGANSLLFGTSQPQTFQALNFLFAHLAFLRSEDVESPWRRLKMVHAKAASTSSAREQFKDKSWELFLKYIYEEVKGVDDGFSHDVGDRDAPHYPIVIPMDTAFTDWDPVSEPSKLLPLYYQRTYEELLKYVDDLIKESSK